MVRQIGHVVGKLEGNRALGKLGTDGRIILKLILNM
jgi:hypothetical protein